MGPIFGILSGLLGAVPGLGQLSGVVGAISGAIGAAGAAGSAGAETPMDAALNTSMSIESWIKSSFAIPAQNAMTAGWQHSMSFENVKDWTGVMAGGYWAGNTLADTGKQDSLMDSTLKFLTIKAINWAWTDSGIFIIRIPYGTKVKKTGGGGTDLYYDSFSEVSCFDLACGTA